MGTIGNNSWPAHCGNFAGSFNSSELGQYTYSSWNGLTTVGNSTAHTSTVSGISSPAGASLVSFAPPDVNDMTLYFVIQMTDMTTPGMPTNGCFQFANHDTTFGGNQEIEFQIRFLSGPATIRITDTTGIVSPPQSAIYKTIT